MAELTVEEARSRIEKIEDEEIQLCLKYQYLICGRASECVSKTYGTRNVYGPTGEVEITKFEDDISGAFYDAAVFPVRTAKRKGHLRKIALPLDPKYEPWTQQVVDYFQSKGKRNVFPFSRQYLWRLARPYFKDMNYNIESYRLWITKKGSVVTYRDTTAIDTELKFVEAHTNPCALHWIRHLRATDLVSAPGYPRRFRFDVFELSYFGGWTLRGLMGLGASRGSGAFERYINLSWENYFPKMLRVK